MVNFQVLFLFDLSAALLMMTIAYLSKRLGDALKIRAYYKLLYATSLITVGASIIDVLFSSVSLEMTAVVSVGLRFLAGAVAVLVSLRYWNWLFAEYFKD